MTTLQIYGKTCQINADYYPCIHTCNIVLKDNQTQLTDFINNCNTVPIIVYKKGFFKNNLQVKSKLLMELILEHNFNNDFLTFNLYNIDKEKNWLALKHIEYKNKVLENVLHT